METIRMNSKPTICALDIGSTKVSMLVAEASADGLKVIGQGHVKHGGVKQGAIVDIGKTTDAIRKAKREAELSSGHDLRQVYVSIGGLNIKSFDSTGLAAVEGSEVTAVDVNNALKTAQAVVLPDDREIIHVLPKEFILDGLSEIKNPIGMAGVRLETNVHLIAGNRTLFPNILKCVEAAGLKVKNFVLQQYASAHAVLSEEEKTLGVCLVEMGGGTSEWIIYKGGVVVATGSVAVGGNNFTNDLAIGLRTAPVNAERIKIEHGQCSFESLEDEFIEVEEVGNRGPRSYSKRSLAEIIGPRAQETLQLIVDDVKNSGAAEELAAGIVLTGGGSCLNGLVEAGVGLDIPIRTAAPSQATSTNEMLNSADQSCAVGLLKFAYSKMAIKRKESTRGAHSSRSGASSSVEDSFKSFGKQFKDFIGL
jgi:cell division protein FtsA